MSKRIYRYGQSVLLLLTVFVVVASFYFQYVVGLKPCPLCMMQRFCAFLLGMFCLMGLCLLTVKRARIVALCQMLLAAGGLFFAIRQLWLQHFAAGEVSSCLPDFGVLVRYFPWHDIVHAYFWGMSDCSEVSWRWLGISMPGWSALYFITMFLVSVYFFWILGRSLSTFRHMG